MTDVEKIALWVGLIASIVSIVLSVVAIVFARIVDKSARDVSAQTIKSLQKIESFVERLSSDTTGLIKAGWDRMLGNVGTPPVDNSTEAAREIAKGLLAEMRAELGLPESEQRDDATPSNGGEKLTEVFENLQNSLEAQLRTQRSSDRPSKALDYILDVLTGLSPEAKALASVIAENKYHLTFDQIQRLIGKSPLGDAVSELRDKGLLVPLEGLSPTGKPIPVYYFPAGPSDVVRSALLLLPEIEPDLQAFVTSELEAVGYNVR